MLTEEEKKQILVTDAEVALFINKVVQATDPNVPELYDEDYFSLADVLKAICPYSSILDGKSLFWFQNWRAKQQLKMNKLKEMDFMYVLKPEYREEAALNSKSLGQPRRW